MKEPFRLLLLPLKRPKTANSTFTPHSHSSSPSTSTSSLPTSPLLHGPSPPPAPLPLPFLFVHLDRTLTRNATASIGLLRQGPLTRFLNWGEAKWQEYGEAGPRTIKGTIHRLGSVLLKRIPVTEKQLWRLHALHQTLQLLAVSATETPRLKSLVLETSAEYATAEQSLRFDLATQLNGWAAHHRRWSIFSSVMLVPTVILSLLPFGKLFLAWVIFRAVAHWRAYQGAHFLARCLNYDRHYSHGTPGSGILPVKFVANAAIDRHLPLPATHTSATRGFHDPFVGLARDMELYELATVLPVALDHVVKMELRATQSASGMKRRKFSNQNMLEP